jgi:hypothetical protein
MKARTENGMQVDVPPDLEVLINKCLSSSA